jgi:hypothetical protein
MGLGENHKQRLMSTFQYIDKLFSNIEKLLSVQSHGLFEQIRIDISPLQQEVLEHGIAEFRTLMHRMLESMDIPIPPPSISAQRAVLSSFTFVDIAIEELKAKYMQGYGELEEGASEELESIVSRMKEMIQRTTSLFLEHSAGGRKKANS